MSTLKSCPCRGSCVVIDFVAPVTVRHCMSCNAQSWFAGDDEVSAEQAFALLRGSFAEQRHRAPRRPRRRRLGLADRVTVVDIRGRPEPDPVQPPADAGTLAAALAAKGLAGWTLST